MSLAKVQNTFLATLDQQSTDFLAMIADTGRLAPVTGVEIYRNNITASFLRTLKAIYPVCVKLVGEEFFAVMAHQYIAATPSVSPSLNDYGEDFAGFIVGFAPAASLPYLADVACLEWAYHVAFNGPDHEALAVSQLLGLDERQVCLALPQNATYLCSDYPVERIWRVNQVDYQGDGVVDLDEGGNRLLVWREGFTVLIERFSVEQGVILSLLDGGVSLVELCEDVGERDRSIDVVKELSGLCAFLVML